MPTRPKDPANQVVIDSAMYVSAQDQFAPLTNNVPMRLYDSTELNPVSSSCIGVTLT